MMYCNGIRIYCYATMMYYLMVFSKVVKIN
jgi:hypothetical protein